MNILIPHSWLLEHLQTEAKPQEIQKYLSLCGPSVERILEKEGEAVYDIEITTNRVDSMSVRGIAREAAAILHQFQIEAKFLALDNIENSGNLSTLPMIKIVNDPKLCKRVSYVILEGVKHQPTPTWMAKRLKQIDQNVHDSVIDITNYVTHELGHPCHAFDYDKLIAKGGEIQIVEAQKGERFTTLDGENFVTVGGEVVFKNAQGEIIDLPSIKGTLNTSVDDQTSNVLLLMESIKAEKVRFASMTHAIRTTAAQLMEKGVDPHLATVVMKKAIKLYQDICQTQFTSKIYDDFPQTQPTKPIILDEQIVRKYLGVNLEQSLIAQILLKLECQVTIIDAKKLQVAPPSFRPDLEKPVDLVEEIARIYGYHHLPAVLMPTRLPLNPPQNQNFDLEDKIKNLLAHLGVQELYTYSLVSSKLAEKSGFALTEHIKLQNPLSEDKVYLRRSLTPSLVEAIEENPHYQALQFFEIANIYQPKARTLPQEKLTLGLVFKTSYRHARGIIEVLFDSLFIKNYQFTPNPTGQKAEIIVQDTEENQLALGVIQSLPNGLIAVELDTHQLFSVSLTHPTYQAIAKTTPVIEDLTFTLAPQTKVGEISEMIQTSSDKVVKVELKNIYQQNFTFTITYLDTQTNLTNQTVKPMREAIVTKVESAQLAKLVGILE